MSAQPSSTIVATYDYTDEHGEVIGQVVRYTPKNFKQRRLDASGEWIWDMKGVRLPIYHPECDTKSPSQPLRG